MKKFKNVYVIGIDHGYGNMKTANCCFPTGIMRSDTEPTFISDLLCWNGNGTLKIIQVSTRLQSGVAVKRTHTGKVKNVGIFGQQKYATEQMERGAHAVQTGLLCPVLMI